MIAHKHSRQEKLELVAQASAEHRSCQKHHSGSAERIRARHRLDYALDYLDGKVQDLSQCFGWGDRAAELAQLRKKDQKGDFLVLAIVFGIAIVVVVLIYLMYTGSIGVQ